MKILCITEELPYPLDSGGNVRTFNLMKSLAVRHEIILIATSRCPVDDAAMAALGSICKRIRVERITRRGLFSATWIAVTSLLMRRSLILNRHRYKAVERAIVSELQLQKNAQTCDSGDHFDAVYFNHLDAAVYEPLIPKGIFRILDEHNVLVNQAGSMLGTEHNFVRSALLRREVRVLKKLEPQICNKMNLCLACSEVDAQAIRSLGVTAAIAEIPNGVDISAFSWDEKIADRAHEVVFFGTLDYPPCEQGLWYFLKSIFPLLHSEDPTLSVKIVGRNPSRRLTEFSGSCSNVRLTGRVPDIRSHVQRAKVCIVPLLSGSGTRLKILEAFALGTPVVTTTIGVEGICASNGEHLLISDEPREFAESVLELVRDCEKSQRLSRNARYLVEKKYDWKEIGYALIEQISKMDLSQGKFPSNS